MTIVPRDLLRSSSVAPVVERLRSGIREFLARHQPSESALILDGPGVGLSTQVLGLALLGPDRLREFRAVHCFSASGYVYLFFLAHRQGQGCLSPHTAESVNRENHRRHWDEVRALGARLRHVARQRSVFDGVLTEDVTRHATTPAFYQSSVQSLPANVHLWTYCQSDESFVDARHDASLRDLRIDQVSRAMTAVPVLYSPLAYDGRLYCDAIWGRGIREHLRQLGDQAGPSLHFHMRKDGVRAQAHYIKMHETENLNVRVALDFLYLVAGVRNSEFDEALRVGLFALDPL